ncbi:MAG TPA: SH3 domain-containing protein [Bacillota bacterium]
MAEGLQEMVAAIQAREAPLLELYQQIERTVSSATARQLAVQMIRSQRFQLATLDLLASGQVPEKFHCFGRITHDDVNVRSGPSARESRTATLHQGTFVIVKELQGNWAHLQWSNGKSGWIFKDYVRCEH